MARAPIVTLAALLLPLPVLHRAALTRLSLLALAGCRSTHHNGFDPYALVCEGA